jgi:hypothetical protein
MIIDNLQLRDNYLVRAEVFQLLRGSAPEQLRGNIGTH